MNVYQKYLMGDLRHKPFETLKQVLFLIPVITIPLFLILNACLPAINQLVYLDHMAYEGYEYHDGLSDSDGSLLVTETLSFARKNDEGLVSVRGVEAFLAPAGSGIDFELTPFREEMTLQGKGAAELEPGEAIISKNVAQSLGVEIGDTVLLGGDDRMLSTAQEFTLAGIVQPKYEYGCVDKRWGVALAATAADGPDLAVSRSVSFFGPSEQPEGEDVVTLEDERRDVRSLLSLKGSYLMIVLAAAVLVILIISKEVSYSYKRMQSDVATLLSFGASAGAFLFWFGFEEYVLLLLAAALSVGLSAAIFTWPVLELTLSAGVAVQVWGCIALLELAIVAWFFARKKMRRVIETSPAGIDEG